MGSHRAGCGEGPGAPRCTPHYAEPRTASPDCRGLPATWHRFTGTYALKQLLPWFPFPSAEAGKRAACAWPPQPGRDHCVGACAPFADQFTDLSGQASLARNDEGAALRRQRDEPAWARLPPPASRVPWCRFTIDQRTRGNIESKNISAASGTIWVLCLSLTACFQR